MPDDTMPGRIGAYDLVREIGRGGMGVVYLGHDPKLDRPVAIKALTEDFADDPERLARFEREARILASLSHGNIATVYGFEECDGRRFLVMEFVEGETLGDRLADGPLTVNESLSVCAQIAAGVEAAHEAGVVHRDLKPGNVIIRPDGTPKVLDFGLARELPARSSRSALIEAATVAPEQNVTQEGASIGTPGYMSPEQVRGMMVDRRTDNFAFGCILYECLAGALAFPGPTATDSIAAILQTEPQWKALPEGTPPTVQLLLRRCLHKDRRRRLRDIGDARIELEQAIDDPTSTSLGLAGAALMAAGRRRRSPLDALPWVIAAAAVIAVLLTWWLTRPAPAPPKQIMRFNVAVPDEHPLRSWPYPIIAADGSRMAFICRIGTRSELYLRHFDQPAPVLLDGTTGAYHPFFSPDGEWIAYGQDGKLKKVSVRGGPSTTLCSAPNLRGGAWGPDGTIIASLERRGGLSRLLAAGGTPEVITTPEEEKRGSHRMPYFLPDGRGVIFCATTDGGAWDDSAIMLLPFETGEPRRLISNGCHGQYVATGHLVFVREGTLMAAPFDLERQELTGPAVPVLEGVTAPQAGSAAQFSISATGTLAYMTGLADEVRNLTLMDVNGVEQPLGAHTGSFSRARISPDGRQVAITVEEEDNEDIRILELERDIVRPLTFDPADDGSPVWSPDGQWIVFASERDGDVANLYRVRSDFTGVPERLTTCPDHQWPIDWSPDGRTIAFMQRDPVTDGDLWLLHVDEDGAVTGEPEVFIERPGWQWYPMFSPDGRWIAYGSAESGRGEIYVRPASGPGAAVQISTEGGSLAHWSPTEPRIFYIVNFDRPTPLHSVAWSAEGTTLRAQKPEKVLEIGGGAQSVSSLDVTPDGGQFLLVRNVQDQGERREPIVILNWFEELKSKTRNVPTGG